MASIHDLSPELLVLCFEQLYVEKQPLNSLRNLNLACNYFHKIVSKLLFRDIGVILSRRDHTVNNDSTALIAFLHRNEKLRAHVQNMFIIDDVIGGYPVINQATQNALELLLPMLPNLRYVRYVHVY